jgi:hypothetical protein
MAVVTRSTILPASPDAVWAALQRPAVLLRVARPLVHIEPIDPPAFPATWDEGAYRVRMWLFGVVPLGGQVLRVERLPPVGAKRRLRDDGHGLLAQRWDHLITIEPTGTGQTRYTDRVDIEAGVLTPLVWTFAHVFYAHRQRRWHALIAEGHLAEG